MRKTPIGSLNCQLNDFVINFHYICTRHNFYAMGTSLIDFDAGEIDTYKYLIYNPKSFTP